MGLFSFPADAGIKVFGGGSQEAPVQQLTELEVLTLRQHVAGLGLEINNLDVKFNGPGEITIYGQAHSRADYEKAALMAGNVIGIAKVNNEISIAHPPELLPHEDPESATYTVREGDSLRKIAQEYYGDGNGYEAILRANQPMIRDPDEIYPGQVLRIPPLKETKDS